MRFVDVRLLDVRMLAVRLHNICLLNVRLLNVRLFDVHLLEIVDNIASFLTLYNLLIIDECFKRLLDNCNAIYLFNTI